MNRQWYRIKELRNGNCNTILSNQCVSLSMWLVCRERERGSSITVVSREERQWFLFPFIGRGSSQWPWVRCRRIRQRFSLSSPYFTRNVCSARLVFIHLRFSSFLTWSSQCSDGEQQKFKSVYPLLSSQLKTDNVKVMMILSVTRWELRERRLLPSLLLYSNLQVQPYMSPNLLEICQKSVTPEDYWYPWIWIITFVQFPDFKMCSIYSTQAKCAILQC